MPRSSQRAASLRKALLLAALAALAAPAPARAHVRTGSVAVGYRVRVFPTRLPLSVHVYLGDRAVRLSARPGHSVTVPGYGGDPFLRIDDAGVTVLRSPTAAALRITPRHTSGRSFLWHDARVRGLPPGLDRGRWTIPLLVDGRRTRLAGELVRVEAPPIWPWLALGLPFVAATALVLVRRALLERSAVVLGALAGTRRSSRPRRSPSPRTPPRAGGWRPATRPSSRSSASRSSHAARATRA
jgi:hypothetical protein